MTVVVPPMAADRVAVSNVSAFIWPMPDICSIWQWGSTPPGVTMRPVASSVSVPVRSVPSAAIRPPAMAISAVKTASAVATRPPLMTMSYRI
jgi:hypothetical protein